MRSMRKDVGKYIGTFTARGQTSEPISTSDTPTKINLFDGRFDTGYVVREFHVWGGDWGSSGDPDVIGKLATAKVDNTAADGFMDASDQNEIGWAGGAGGAEQVNQFEAIIDPHNLVIEDLYVFARGSTAGVPINYMIVMDKYEITDALGAVTMARTHAQRNETQ